jgi:hypothetical protein
MIDRRVVLSWFGAGRLAGHGSGQQRLTRGGKETNRLFDWTHDGKRLETRSNARNPSAIDAYLVDPVGGASDMVVENDALATLDDVSHDNSQGLVSRLVSRGDNNLYLVDFKTHRETPMTPHSGPGTFVGKLSPDGRGVPHVQQGPGPAGICAHQAGGRR